MSQHADTDETRTTPVFVRQFREPLAVLPGETILEAALRAGEVYPHGCTLGQCGACKSVLIEGTVHQRPGFKDTTLTERERASALFLACGAEPQGACEVALLDRREPARFPVQRLEAEVAAVTDAAPSTKRVALRLPAGQRFFYEPGQFATLTFEAKDGALPPRDYSLARPAGDDGAERLEFHIGHQGEGPLAHFVAEDLAPGMTVRLEGPFGVSYLRRGRPGPILLAGGGTGLAPLLAIAEAAVAEGKTQEPIRLLIAQRTPDDHYDLDRLAALADASPNLTVTLLVDRAAEGDFVARTPADEIATRLKDLAGWQCYFAGPAGLVGEARAAALAAGARPGDCHADAFVPTSEKEARGQEGLRQVVLADLSS